MGRRLGQTNPKRGPSDALRVWDMSIQGVLPRCLMCNLRPQFPGGDLCMRCRHDYPLWGVSAHGA